MRELIKQYLHQTYSINVIKINKIFEHEKHYNILVDFMYNDRIYDDDYYTVFKLDLEKFILSHRIEKINKIKNVYRERNI